MISQNKMDVVHELESSLQLTKGHISEHDRDQIIEKYTPFIIKQVSLALGRYLRTDQEDAFVIGMEAFNEAIDKYDPSKGSLVNFAALVIKSRVIDHLRREQRYMAHEILEEPSNQIFTQSANPSFQNEQVTEEVIEEIQSFKVELLAYDITFESLIQSAPKHTRTRSELIHLSKRIASDLAMMTTITTKRHLPMQEITLKYGTTKKVLKSHRNFILACTIVFEKHYTTMMTYLKVRGENHD